MLSSALIKDLATDSSFQDFYKSYTAHFIRLLESVSKDEVTSLYQQILKTNKTGNRIYLIGNGGSASTATHIATGLNYITNTWQNPMRAISLCADSTALTSLSNDLGFENVFAKQLEIFWQPGDLLIGLSTSGNSQNVLNAFSYVKSRNGITCSMVGNDGGKLKTLSDLCVHIKSQDVIHGPIEDIMQVLAHLICYYIEHSPK